MSLTFSAFALSIIVAAPLYAASGSMTVAGIVPGPPPSMAPTIDSPINGQVFTDENITVSGECISGLVVEVFRNSIFAGSALCQDNGTYSMPIDLYIGENDIFSRQYDDLDQASPASPTVSVTYTPIQTTSMPTPSPTPSATTTPLSTPSSTSSTSSSTTSTKRQQLVLQYNYTRQGVSINQPFYVPIQFSGGVPPYAISINWGDGSTSVFSEQNTTTFTADHTYAKAGYYTVVIQIADQQGDVAFMQFVVLVNGPQTNSPIVKTVFGRTIVIPTTWQMVEASMLSVISGFVIGGIASHFGFGFNDVVRKLVHFRTRKSQ
jgi:hypothetical protein